MARRFKKRLAPKIKAEKNKPVLSVSLIRKENVARIKTLINKVSAFTRKLVTS